MLAKLFEAWQLPNKNFNTYSIIQVMERLEEHHH